MLLKTSFPYTGGFLCCPNKMVRFTGYRAFVLQKRAAPHEAAPSRLRNASLLPRIYGISPVVYESRGTMTPLGSAAVSVNASVSRKRTSAAAKSPVKASSVPISSKPKLFPR